MLGRVLLVLATLGMFHGDNSPPYRPKYVDDCSLQLPSRPMNVCIAKLDNHWLHLTIESQQIFLI